MKKIFYFGEIFDKSLNLLIKFIEVLGISSPHQTLWWGVEEWGGEVFGPLPPQNIVLKRKNRVLKVLELCFVISNCFLLSDCTYTISLSVFSNTLYDDL